MRIEKGVSVSESCLKLVRIPSKSVSVIAKGVSVVPQALFKTRQLIPKIHLHSGN